MNKLIFDITNFLAVILISIGVGQHFGYDWSAIVGGALLIVINYSVSLIMTKGQ